MPKSRRGVARKNAIVEATLAVVGEDGMAGLSIRNVAARADIPMAAVGYYFNGKDDLIKAAFERHIRDETARVTRAITRMGASPSPAALADKLADFVIDGLIHSPLQLRAEYEFTVESVRRSGLAEAAAIWQSILQAQVQAVVAGLGSPRPNTDATLILAVLAGLEVDHLATDMSASHAAAIRDVLGRLLSSLALDWTAPQSKKGS